jgi:hypothetical protein
MAAADEANQKAMLHALLEALEDPVRAARLPRDGDPGLDLCLEVARRHRLTPLLSVIAGDALGAKLAEVCRRDRFVTMARNMLLARAAEECVRALTGAGVSTILLKGIAYERALYPSAGSRPTADVDLLVPGDQRRAAFTVLDRLGFEPRAASPGFDEADYHEVAWRRGDVEVDLHLALAPVVRCRIDNDEVWRRARPFAIGETESKMLDAAHAAVFHAVHMAIDHFGVPALYFLDLARLLPSQAAMDGAEAVARAWGCRRPFETTVALSDEFLPVWRESHARRAPRWFARRVASRYGSLAPLPRSEQLARKMMHFDDPVTALRYTAVQARRKAREVVLQRLGARSPRERLALDPK